MLVSGMVVDSPPTIFTPFDKVMFSLSMFIPDCWNYTGKKPAKPGPKRKLTRLPTINSQVLLLLVSWRVKIIESITKSSDSWTKHTPWKPKKSPTFHGPTGPTGPRWILRSHSCWFIYVPVIKSRCFFLGDGNS